MSPDPVHQASLAAAIELPPDELKSRIATDDYTKPNYIASEVLASLVRRRYGETNGVLDRATAALHRRMLILVSSYFRKNPKWARVVEASSETTVEVVGDAWEVLLADKNPTSYAEVRFLPWLELRALDYLRGQLREANQMLSVDGIKEDDEAGPSQFDIPDEDADPALVAQRREKARRLMTLIYTWDAATRHAVLWRLILGYEWEKVAANMKVSIPTARKYYAIGLSRLDGASND